MICFLVGVGFVFIAVILVVAGMLYWDLLFMERK